MAKGLQALVRKLETESSLSEEERAAVRNLRVNIQEPHAGQDVVRERDKPVAMLLHPTRTALVMGSSQRVHNRPPAASEQRGCSRWYMARSCWADRAMVLRIARPKRCH
jgi:hypothetical protein